MTLRAAATYLFGAAALLLAAAILVAIWRRTSQPLETGTVPAPSSAVPTAVPAPPTPVARVARAAPPPEPAEASIPTGPPVDNVYRTRRFAKLSESPDQARVFLDGRYVGIADDWDD